ncbi:MAG TPA: IS110 family transposase [Chloroflexi bacterium]|nr:IS110 family transposase [Chloroflexota bacterium]
MSSVAEVVPATRSIIYLGMDVHKESITIAVLPNEARAPTRLDRLPNDLPKLRRYLERLAQGGDLRACYEASGAGYVIHRAMREWGYACDVIAPSLVPKRPGVQRKHDKRDAADLSRLYRAGELTAVRIPSETDERVRDVVRCRETFQREILKSRHYILKFLARRGFVFREGTNWCTPHLRWLQYLTTDASPLAAHDRLVFREYHALLLYKLQRRDDLDRTIEQLALLPTLAPMVERLQCFRGISLHSAMVLATEIVDWRRFEHPRQLACYLGLVSREDSSGDRTRLGSITKAGNSHCRHVLVQAAWSYHHRPQISVDLKRRQQGQPPAVIAHAWKAQQRLHKRYNHLAYRKRPQIAVVAVARELVGFLWAVMRDLEPAAQRAA